MIKNEWKSLWNNKILIIVVMAIIIISSDLCRLVSEIHVGSIWKSGSASGGSGQ